jgi:hypothetical protein
LKQICTPVKGYLPNSAKIDIGTVESSPGSLPGCALRLACEGVGSIATSSRSGGSESFTTAIAEVLYVTEVEPLDGHRIERRAVREPAAAAG